MVWFQRIFPILMILFPVFTVLVLPTRLRATANRAGLARLWIATGVFLALHFAVFLTLEGWFEVRSAWRVGWPVFVGVLGSTFLWFAFAGRLFNDPARKPFRPGSAVRTASLVPRHRNDPVPRSAWTVGWLVFAACAATLVWAMAAGATPAIAAGLGFWLFSGPLAARMSLLGPEPMDPRGSAELAAAYEKLRAFKAWTFFWMGLVGTLAFTGIGITLALRPDIGGWVGAGVGVAIGVAGSVIGVVGGLRRARVHEMQQELAEVNGE